MGRKKKSDAAARKASYKRGKQFAKAHGLIHASKGRPPRRMESTPADPRQLGVIGRIGSQ